MAWLQNLAGKAENLLNKIDQNAANVLNETNTKSQIISIKTEEEPRAISTYFEEIKEEKEQDAASVASDKSKHEYESDRSSPNVSIFEKTFKSERSSSINTSELENKISHLEQQNQQLNRQILNLQHLYSETKNENVVLTEQLQRANECVAATNAEMEQYRARAQRVLQEKEKLITYKSQIDSNDADSVLTNYLEELKKELVFQEQKNEELNVKLQSVSLELTGMQQQFFEATKIHQETIHRMEEALSKERKLLADTEDELRLKNQETQLLSSQIAQKTQILKAKDEELERIKTQFKQNKSYTSNNDLESRMHSLTETLMSKQSNLETVTTERNALRLQLEKLENEYHKLMSQIQHTTVKIETVNDTDDAKSQVPQFMRVSPLDASVTKRVKRAYSTLDAFSIRTGVFLRRYPLARVFVFSYCVLLHFWVIIILFTYVPSVR